MRNKGKTNGRDMEMSIISAAATHTHTSTLDSIATIKGVEKEKSGKVINRYRSSVPIFAFLFIFH